MRGTDHTNQFVIDIGELRFGIVKSTRRQRAGVYQLIGLLLDLVVRIV